MHFLLFCTGRSRQEVVPRSYVRRLILDESGAVDLGDWKRGGGYELEGIEVLASARGCY
jgi:hypothetical protein